MAIVTVIPGTFTAADLPTLGVLGFADTFERPDAEELGHTEGMPRLPWKLWAASEVTGRIRDGAAEFARTTAGPAVAVADAKAADVTIECTLGAINGSQSGIAIRATSSADYWSLRAVGASVRLYRTVANSAGSVLESTAVAPAPGTVLRAVTSGQSIACYANGVHLFTHNSPDLMDATHHGLYTSNGISLNSWRDVKVTG